MMVVVGWFCGFRWSQKIEMLQLRFHLSRMCALSLDRIKLNIESKLDHSRICIGTLSYQLQIIIQNMITVLVLWMVSLHFQDTDSPRRLLPALTLEQRTS